MIQLIEKLFADYPAVIRVLLSLLFLHYAFGVLAKIFLQAAAFFGKVKKPWAKPIGRKCWLAGRFCMIFSSNMPERYFDAKYQPRGPKHG